MSDVTRVLSAIEQGDGQAADELLPLVYDELRRLASAKLGNEKPGQTLQATALVHEAYLRLVDVQQAQHWDSRGHFFAAAAEAMRRILVEQARRKNSLKHGGDQRRVELSVADPLFHAAPERILELDETLEILEREDPDASKIVVLHVFAGLSVEQAGEALGLSRASAYRSWTYARAWLKARWLDDQ